jgi:hypothetical protein
VLTGKVKFSSLIELSVRPQVPIVYEEETRLPCLTPDLLNKIGGQIQQKELDIFPPPQFSFSKIMERNDDSALIEKNWFMDRDVFD